MPETPATRGRGPKVNNAKRRKKSPRPKQGAGSNRSASGTSLERNEKQQNKRQNTQQSKAIKHNSSVNIRQDIEDHHTEHEEEQKDNEPTDPEEKLIVHLESCLADCSRQRLRALHMSLRHYGNVDNRVTYKDMQTSLQENQIKVTSRALQMMSEIFEDAQGVDYERLYVCLGKAHLKTGRDSIKARSKRNDLEAKQVMTQEEIDSDFLRRLEELIVKDQTFFDTDVLRSEFAKWDQHRVGKMDKEGAYLICNEKTPLYGALLKNLIKRCDEDNDNKISWPLLLNFLEKAQAKAWEKYPELSSLPERYKEMAAVRIATPEPIDELSSTTKTKVMTKLMQKTSLRRNSAEANPNGADSESSNQKESKNPIKTRFKLEWPTKKEITESASQIQAFTMEDETKEPESTNQSEPTILAAPEEAAGSENTDKPEVIPDVGNDKNGQGTEEVKEADDKPKEENVQRKDDGDKKREGSAASQQRGKDQQGSAKEKTGEGEDAKEGGEKKGDFSKENGAAEKGTVIATQNESDARATPKAASTPQQEARESPSKYNHEGKVTRIPPDEVTAVVPRNYEAPRVKADPPKETLALDWVYGYRGHDCSCNLDLLASGEVIYFIANVIIMYNSKEHQQRHYREHTENVKCLTVHSGGMIVASGQFASKDPHGNKAHVRIWRSDILQTLHILGNDGTFAKSVVTMAFMPGMDILACADNASEKKLTIWDTNEGTLVADTFITTEVLCDLDFNPKFPELLVSCGKEHLAWWKIYVEGKRIQPHANPNYESYLKARYVNCLRHNQRGDLITGDSNGTVYVWGNGGSSITNFVKHGHEGPVFDVLQFRHHLLTAGRDGALRCWTWNKNMDNEGAVQLPKSEGGIRTQLVLPSDDVRGATLLLGTTMNSLLHVRLNQTGSPLEGVALEDVPITQGHTDDLRAIHKIRQSFLGADVISASSDGVICKLNSERREPVWKLWMKGYSFLCVDTTREGDHLVLGTKDGHLIVFQVMKEDMTVVEVLNVKLSSAAINAVKLAPDERSIAAAGAEKEIYIYKLQKPEVAEVEIGPMGPPPSEAEAWVYHGKCTGHAGHIHAIDWSSTTVENTLVLRTSSSIPEQKFWSVTSCEELSGEIMTDVIWASFNCILDHSLIGLWRSKQASEGHVTCVDVSPNKNSVVAMATTHGSLSLFRYPCKAEGAFSHAYRSHHHTYNLCFTPNGRCLLTVGGPDVCIMQWKLV